MGGLRNLIARWLSARISMIRVHPAQPMSASFALFGHVLASQRLAGIPPIGAMASGVGGHAGTNRRP